jgi:murein DD-endopeptidase
MNSTRYAFAVLLIALLAGCAATAPRDERDLSAAAAHADAPRTAAGQREAIAALARRMVGTPYLFGGDDPAEGFDCSGLIHFAFAGNGIDVPRTAQQQYRVARKIPLDEAAAADLVFFQDQQKLSHVGLYLGDGWFVHAPSSGSTVRVSSLDSEYYRTNLVGVARLLDD